MATECTQEAILAFLTERGGRVKNTDLTNHFKAIFPDDPEKKAMIREKFKSYVDNIAFVKSESGVKFVCLKKKFRGSVKENACVGNGTSRSVQGLDQERDTVAEHGSSSVTAQQPGPTENNDAAPEPSMPCAAGGEVQQEISPGSGYGNDSQVRVPHAFSPAPILADKTDEKSNYHEFVCVVEDVESRSREMGSLVSSSGESKTGESKEQCGHSPPDIPQIAVIEASPLPATADGTMFTLPSPTQTGTAGQADTCAGLNPSLSVDRQVEIDADSLSGGNLSEADQNALSVVTLRPNSRGSQHRLLPGQPESEGEDEVQSDTQSLSGSEGNSTPKGSRKHFIEVMMNSSPQVRRSIVFRNSVYLSSRSQDSKSDSDSASLISCTLEDDRTSVALDPLEHEWMMCASDGQWDSLHRLLTTEPYLLLKKDFVTGFTCLHWAAKHGKSELLALIINFAKQQAVPIDVNVRSNTGYTPLHLAAMHNHMEVVKLLVGAYDADVEIRDYSGKKACQYLTNSVTADMRDIIGAYESCHSENAHARDRGRWRFSKVLPSNLKPLRLRNHNESNSVEGESHSKQTPLMRTSSFSRMKQKIRYRTSQIVHSRSFRDTEELESSLKGLFKSRPKSHFYG
ncbi:ankyrin repeat domain-containing protein SOWAHC-like [Myripristis murdjan]|uniref:ankyrin repeat domain-containing protein SOWAHC-like n=1 Tax=Myripristis murdjan TaxID=586833 RepID=UPI0011760705|nr:ankyrin repeat domain-containing protein SOWAHC-like [Myripristis murdjan]